MSKEKQIEEMARACCWGGARDGKSCEECLNDSILKLKGNECEWKTRVAKALFDAGYRKQSEVAREIFAVTDILGTYNPAMYDELKKKYAGADEKPFRRDHQNGDVVEVVRCKDCAVPHNKWTGCPNLNGLIPPPDFYCAKGERRADNEQRKAD